MSAANPSPEAGGPCEQGGPVREDIRAMSAYTVPDHSGLVKLDAMESPHQLPDGITKEVAVAIGRLHLNRYPDMSARRLRESVRRRHSVPGTHDIILGNGSDELIQLLVQACCGGGRGEGGVMGLEPSFVMYEQIARVAGAEWDAVGLDRDFDIDTDRTLERIRQRRPRLFFAASPNNPTGNALSAERLDRVAEAMLPCGWLVVDEAYQAYSGSPSLLGRYAGRRNVLLMGTLSKLGLAGIRLGHLAGRSEHIAQLEKVRLPYNINSCTQVIAAIVLDRFEEIGRLVGRTVSEREGLAEELGSIPGVRVHPSRANFLLVEVPDASAHWAGLAERRVLVKRLAGPIRGKADRHLRITVGNEADNRALTRAFRETREALA